MNVEDADLTGADGSLNVHGVVLDSRRVYVPPHDHINHNAMPLQCHWPSSIYNYDSEIIIHTSIKSLDLKDGRWIECQCKSNKRLVMRQPFEHGNFAAHLLTHSLAPSSQMSIRSFLQPCSSDPHCPFNVDPTRNSMVLLQQPQNTPSPCMGSLVLPVNADIKRKLILLSKYGLSTTEVVIVRNVCTQDINLKSASCTNKFIKRNGRQPNCCSACFELHQKKIRFKLFKKMIPYDEAEDALQATEISSIQIKALQSFLRINDKFHNPEGLEFKWRILHFQAAIMSSLSKQIGLSDGSVPGLDLLIGNFSNFYRNNESFRSSAFVGIMSALITKMTDKGANNPPWNDKALNLCMLMSNQCPKAYNIFMQKQPYRCFRPPLAPATWLKP
jgi:hypothetical protein